MARCRDDGRGIRSRDTPPCCLRHRRESRREPCGCGGGVVRRPAGVRTGAARRHALRGRRRRQWNEPRSRARSPGAARPRDRDCTDGVGREPPRRTVLRRVRRQPRRRGPQR